MARISYGLKAGAGRPAFLTLTSLPGTTVPEMMAAWNRFRVWVKRRSPNSEYVAVKQFGSRNGMLHLHVAFTDWAYIPQRDISAAWGRFSGARIVDVKEIRDPDGAAVYVARYIARELASTEVVKCVTYSRGWPKVDRPERNWRIQGEIIDYVPTGPLLGEIGGCLVYRVGVDCECLGEVRDLGLNGHLALMRIERLRGPP